MTFEDITIVEEIGNIFLPNAKFIDVAEKMETTFASGVKIHVLPDKSSDGSVIYSITLTLSAEPTDYWKRLFLELHNTDISNITLPITFSETAITIQFIPTYIFQYYATIQNEIALTNQKYTRYLWYKERNDKREKSVQAEERELH